MRYHGRSGILAAAALTLALGSPAWAAGRAGAGPAVFPGCSWPVETTPTKANVAAPDSFATYWTTPFLAGPGDAVTIRGSFPTSRFMSFVVYNDSFQDFTNVVGGKNVPSDLSDYQIRPDPGSNNPWRTSSAGQRQNFTVRIRPTVTAAQRRAANAIPMIDQNAPADPQGPPGLGYVILRAYIPSGGNTTVRLPALTVTHDGRTATLPQCASAAGRSGPAAGPPPPWPDPWPAPPPTPRWSTSARRPHRRPGCSLTPSTATWR